MYNFASDGVAHHTHQAVVESEPSGATPKGSSNTGMIIVLVVLVALVTGAIYFYRRSNK